MGLATSFLRFAKLRSAVPEPPRPVQILELHVTHACNLTCESCSHYSNHGHKGHVTVAEADAWMGLWCHRLDVKQFDLLGGEPTVHPELPAFVSLVRRHWPNALIRVLTNGFFLYRHPKLPALLADVGNAAIRLSIHHDAPEYRERLQPIVELLVRWRNDYGISVDAVESHKHWTRRYQGFGSTMMPFDDQTPRKSWEICPAKYCKQLFQGKPWKCAPLAYLQMQKAAYALSSKWDPYLAYQPLSAECSTAELDQFLALEEEGFCGMCSGKPRPFKLPVPVRALAGVAASAPGAVAP
jgi:hypothetical protein